MRDRSRSEVSRVLLLYVYTNKWLPTEFIFLYSSFVLLCVRFRMAVGNQLAIRVFAEKGLQIFVVARSMSKSSLS